MTSSINSSSFLKALWPDFWPPHKFPPPSPLASAAASLWTPKVGVGSQAGNDLTAVAPTSLLYSTQLRQGGQAAPEASQGTFTMAFLDQRIALVRYDASHGSAAA
jgi:hypothetical protein